MSTTLASYQPADPGRIDLTRIRDLYFWIAQFGCSAEQLRAAVARVGNSAVVVEATLAVDRAAYVAPVEVPPAEPDCLELFF